MKKQTMSQTKAEMPTIRSSKDGADIFRQIISEDKIELKEMFFVCYLNRANRVLGVMQSSEGHATGTVCNVQEIVRTALNLNAQGIMLCHNHPSGNLNASKADIEQTEKVKKAAELFDISLIDHIIITADSYYSFADEFAL